MKDPVDILWRLPRFAGFLRKKPRLALQAARYQVRRREGGPTAVRAVEYAVTYECQARCAKCSATRLAAGSGPPLSEEGERLFGEACHALGVYEVNFTGGEPLLRPDLEEVAARFHPESTFLGINTNGERLDRRRVLSLREAGIDLVKISLDSPVPEDHDRSRGLPGLFDHIIDILKFITKIRGIRGHICMVTTREAIAAGQVHRMLALAHSLDATLGLVLPAAIGGWSRRHEVLLTASHRRSLDALSSDPAVFVQGNIGQRGFVCPCGTEEIYITRAGEVIPCPFIQISFGSLRDEPLERIVSRMARWKRGAGDGRVCSSTEDPAFRARYLEPLHDQPNAPLCYRDHPAFKGSDAVPGAEPPSFID